MYERHLELGPQYNTYGDLWKPDSVQDEVGWRNRVHVEGVL